jgi:hypothetical protein
LIDDLVAQRQNGGRQPVVLFGGAFILADTMQQRVNKSLGKGT